MIKLKQPWRTNSFDTIKYKRSCLKQNEELLKKLQEMSLEEYKEKLKGDLLHHNDTPIEDYKDLCITSQQSIIANSRLLLQTTLNRHFDYVMESFFSNGLEDFIEELKEDARRDRDNKRSN